MVVSSHAMRQASSPVLACNSISAGQQLLWLKQRLVHMQQRQLRRRSGSGPCRCFCSALVAGQARGAASTSLRQLCLYNFIDIAAALGLALIVNVAVLLVAAATFHQAGEPQHTTAGSRA